MTAKTATVEVSARSGPGTLDIQDVTDLVAGQLRSSGLREGLATVFVPHSTAALTTIEFEPGVVGDLKAAVQRLVPEGTPYGHNRGGEDNGHSHVRSSLVGPSVTIPFSGGKLLLGTWQQVIFLDFDTRSRRRQLVIQLLGE